MDTLHVSTPGLVCGERTSVVEKAVAKVPGAVSVTATLSGNSTSVLFDERRTDRIAVIAAIRRAGFDAEVE